MHDRTDVEKLTDEVLVDKLIHDAREAGVSVVGLVKDEFAGARREVIDELRKELLERLAGKKIFIIDSTNICFRNVPLSPEDIDLSDGLSDTFGDCEVEKRATNLVGFFQCRKSRCGSSWCPFTLEDLRSVCFSGFGVEDLYETKKDELLMGLNGVWWGKSMVGGNWKIAPPYIVLCQDGKFRITNLFLQKILKHVRKGVRVDQLV